VEARTREAAREAAIDRVNAAMGTARRERLAPERFTPERLAPERLAPERPPRYEPARPVPSPPTPFIPNAGLVRAKLEETETVAALLGEIFAAEDHPVVPAPAPVGAGDDQIGGLDAAHTRLLRTLSGHASWTRADFRAAAASVGLLPDGALDVLNEAALETCGDVVCEGEDPIEMNPTVLQELGL
jgi:hypothetical protein